MEFARSEAPRLGLEPRTYRLTAGRSTIELSGNETGPILPHVMIEGLLRIAFRVYPAAQNPVPSCPIFRPVRTRE
jgi:hypothetical protein